MGLKNERALKVVAVFSFIFAFICLILTVSQLYTFVNRTPPNTIATTPPPPPADDFFRGMPKDSPFMLTFYIIGFLINSTAGMALYDKAHHAQKKELKAGILDAVLLPDEKRIVRLLEENDGELAQSELVKLSGLGKLKVSRAIKRLETADVVKKHPYGLTNKIQLKR